MTIKERVALRGMWIMDTNTIYTKTFNEYGHGAPRARDWANIKEKSFSKLLYVLFILTQPNHRIEEAYAASAMEKVR